MVNCAIHRTVLFFCQLCQPPLLFAHCHLPPYTPPPSHLPPPSSLIEILPGTQTLPISWHEALRARETERKERETNKNHYQSSGFPVVVSVPSIRLASRTERPADPIGISLAFSGKCLDVSDDLWGHRTFSWACVFLGIFKLIFTCPAFGLGVEEIWRNLTFFQCVEQRTKACC